MAELLDSALSFKDDETRMADLQQRGGLESLGAATAAYQTATELVMDKLVELAEEPQASRSLFRAGRWLKQTAEPDPSRFFADAGSFDGQELLREVFGSDAPVVVDSVADASDLPTDKALNLVQIATAVIISLAAGEPDDAVSLDSITAPIRNERRAEPLVTADTSVAGPLADGAAPLADTAPEIAVAHAAQSDPVQEPEEAGKRKAWLLALVPVAAIAGVGLLVASSGGDQPADVVAFDAESDAGTTTTTATQPTTTDEPETAADSSTVPPMADATTAPPTDDTPQPATEVPSPPAPPGAPANYSILSGGKIFLRGTVPSTEIETAIVAAVTQILGPGNVISEYEIDPSESFEEGRESFVFIDEAVLFATGSAEIAPDFAQLLGLGLTLLQLQEGVTLEVTGHTDAQGDDAANLVLSQARVDAVKAFFVSQGIDSDRIVAVGKGETEPRAGNDTPEGRQANRRVEFIVEGFSFS